MMIEKISVVTAQGASTYAIGLRVAGVKVDRIEKESLIIDGDPFQHYCGFDKNNKMLFSISCHAPCEIEYT